MKEEQICEKSTLFSDNVQILFEENHGPSGYYSSDKSTWNDNVDDKWKQKYHFSGVVPTHIL